MSTGERSSSQRSDVAGLGGREVPDAASELGAVTSCSRAVAVELVEAVAVGQRGFGMATPQPMPCELRVGPRSWFGATADRALTVDSVAVRGPWQVRAVGSPEVMYVAMTRTGGIIGQFELIYKGTRFDVSRESALDLPALATPLR